MGAVFSVMKYVVFLNKILCGCSFNFVSTVCACGLYGVLCIRQTAEDHSNFIVLSDTCSYF